MTSIDDRILPKVVATLNRVGTDATFRVVSEHRMNVVTGDNAEVNTQFHTVKATPPSRVKVRNQDGSLIDAGVSKILIAGQNIPFTPVNDMRVTVNDVDYLVDEVEPIYSGASIAAYKLLLRT